MKVAIFIFQLRLSVAPDPKPVKNCHNRPEVGGYRGSHWSVALAMCAASADDNRKRVLCTKSVCISSMVEWQTEAVRAN